MQNQTAAHAYAHSYIAPELLARLRNLKSHKDHLPRQVNSFSNVYYHPGLVSRRWYTPVAALPHPHVITTYENGTKISFFALISKASAVVHLKMRNGIWWIDEIYDESDIGAFLPAHTSYSGGRLRSPASDYQMHKLGQLLLLRRHDLPKLTKYNASHLIQEILVAPDLQEIMALIARATKAWPGHIRRAV